MFRPTNLWFQASLLLLLVLYYYYYYYYNTLQIALSFITTLIRQTHVGEIGKELLNKLKSIQIQPKGGYNLQRV